MKLYDIFAAKVRKSPTKLKNKILKFNMSQIINFLHNYLKPLKSLKFLKILKLTDEAISTTSKNVISKTSIFDEPNSFIFNILIKFSNGS